MTRLHTPKETGDLQFFVLPEKPSAEELITSFHRDRVFSHNWDANTQKNGVLHAMTLCDFVWKELAKLHFTPGMPIIKMPWDSIQVLVESLSKPELSLLHCFTSETEMAKALQYFEDDATKGQVAKTTVSHFRLKMKGESQAMEINRGPRRASGPRDSTMRLRKELVSKLRVSTRCAIARSHLLVV